MWGKAARATLIALLLAGLSLGCSRTVGSSAASATVTVAPPVNTLNGPHPRIWLDSETLARLDSKRQSNDPDWVAMQSWCDAHINDPFPATKDYSWGDAGNGYRGSGYAKRLISYALGYQMLRNADSTKANQYADYAVSLMNNMVARFSAGEELDGISMIRQGASTDITINAAEAAANGTVYQATKNGYTARNFGQAFAIAYDWLYDRIAASDKLKFLRVMYRWMDWCTGTRSTYNNGILIGGIRYHEDRTGDCTGINNCPTAAQAPDTVGSAARAYANDKAGVNFHTDYVLMDALIAIATYGDAPESASYLSKFRDYRWASQTLPYINDPLYYKGGNSLEGPSYFSSWQNLIRAMYTYFQATGENLFNNTRFPLEVTESYIQDTASNLKDMVGVGDWPGAYVRRSYEKFVLSPAYILKRMYPTEGTGFVAQDYLDKASFALADDSHQRLLWREDGPAQPISSLNKSYVSIGTGSVTMRSSWDDLPDSNFGFIQLGQGWKMSHQSYDQGTFLIQRGADRLLARNEALFTTMGQNTILFNGAEQYAMNPLPASPPINRYEDSGGIFYVRGDVTNAYKRQYNPDRSELFIREMVFVRPNFYLIKDTARSNTALGNLKDWYTNYIAEPTIAGNTISVTVGSSQAFVTTLLPSGGTYVKTNPSSGYWQVKYTPAVPQEYDQFLHLIEATASTAIQTPIESVPNTFTDGKMAGAYVKDVSEPTIVLFSTSQIGADVAGSPGDTITYNISELTGPAPSHYVVNLPPNTAMTVLPMQDLNGKTFTLMFGSYPALGTVLTTSAQGTLRYSVALP